MHVLSSQEWWGVPPSFEASRSPRLWVSSTRAALLCSCSVTRAWRSQWGHGLPPGTALVAARPCHRQQDCPATLSCPPGLVQPMVPQLHWYLPPHLIPSLEISKVSLDRALSNLIYSPGCTQPVGIALVCHVHTAGRQGVCQDSMGQMSAKGPRTLPGAPHSAIRRDPPHLIL
uniref:Uncharacterized protein n=1 Tax=Geospiza parvula TaxID=87175 RepID=A0A8C3ND94_GEOPR